MMHVRFNEAWNGKVHKQSYKLSGAHYATPLHIDGTPHQLFRSLSVRYSTKCWLTWQEVKHNKTIPFKQFKWGRI